MCDAENPAGGPPAPSARSHETGCPIEVPRVRKRRKTMEKANVAAVAKREDKSREKRTILVADDDLELLMALSTRLRKEGFNVIPTADSYQAFTYASKLKPDAVILDINMPCGDGFSVHQRLRENMLLLSIPVIYLTGEKTTRVRMLAAKMNAFAVVFKPFNTAELMTTVRQAVGIMTDDVGADPACRPKLIPCEID